MEEWKEYELEDLIDEISMGPFGSNIKVECFTDSGVPVLNGSNLVGIKLNEDKFNYVTEEKATSLGKANAYRNDIVITHRGTLGQIVYIPENSKYDHYVISQSQFRVRCNDKVLPQYLVYYFHSRIGQYKLLSNASQVGVPALVRPTTTFQKLTVNIPPFPTQQKIVSILSSLDDKIELNNKINENLEQQAQALFKNWFVDFEPFGGKMPEGWKEADIYSIANIIYGSPFASKLFNTEKNGKPIIRIRDLKDQHSDVYTPEERDDAYLIQPKDIVVGMDGEFRPYIWGSEPGWLNQRVCVFENKRLKGKAFLYFSIKPLLDIVEKTQVATTVIHIGKKDFDKFQIILPTEDILDRFDELTDSILDQIVANRLENHRLAELRNTLLPKLINGEIEV